MFHQIMAANLQKLLGDATYELNHSRSQFLSKFCLAGTFPNNKNPPALLTQEFIIPNIPFTIGLQLFLPKNLI